MTEQIKKRGHWQVWLMIVMLGGVMIAGFLLFPTTQEQRNSLLSSLGTTNHGEFVLPLVSIEALKLLDAEGTPWQLSEQKHKWRLFIAGGGECVEQCREMLYLSRQVHISLGKYSRRFERLYLALDGELSDETAGYIQQNHPFLKVYRGSSQELEDLLKATNAPLTFSSGKQDDRMRAYLVDQKGLVMMSYTLANNGSEMIEDIEHLMKYSPE